MFGKHSRLYWEKYQSTKAIRMKNGQREKMCAKENVKWQHSIDIEPAVFR